jgi:hypothetical protein
VAITFKHICNHEKINKLIESLGHEGYYIYFRTVEYFAIHKNTPLILDMPEYHADLLNYLYMDDIKHLIESYGVIQEITGVFQQNIFERGILQIKEIKPIKEPRDYALAVEGKIKVSSMVFLTQAQIDEFVGKYGKVFYDRCIEVVTDYKTNKNGMTTYNDDAAAIRNWVVDKVMKEKQFLNYDFPNLPKQEKRQPPKFKRPEASDLKRY